MKGNHSYLPWYENRSDAGRIPKSRRHLREQWLQDQETIRYRMHLGQKDLQEEVEDLQGAPWLLVIKLTALCCTIFTAPFIYNALHTKKESVTIVLAK